jgi:NCS1 family nucleobase:cation symporter-1
LNIPDFTRFGRGQKEQMLGQALGLPSTMVIFSAMGVVITSASQVILRGVDPSRLWDPVFILSQLTSAAPPPGQAAPLIASGAVRGAVAAISLFGVGIATLSVNIAANVVSPANDFANLSPRHISFKTGGLITGLLGIAMMPWRLLASADTYIFNWLVGYSALLGPIAGIMIADYWILRRKSLDVADLYRPNGRYGAVNTTAILALVLGIALNVPGFLKSAHVLSGPENVFDSIYVYAWFIGFIVAFVIYLVGMSIAPARSRRGSAGVAPS